MRGLSAQARLIPRGLIATGRGGCQRRSEDTSVGRSKSASGELARRPPAGGLLAFRRYVLVSPVGWFSARA